MSKKIFEKAINFINFSVKVDANSTNTTVAFQPKLPKQYKKFKKNNDK
ncbi:MAG: hypothetical protein IJS03_04595 [Eubacterium sp.]|nr:hypothetical protein [Eubacterium sp.]